MGMSLRLGEISEKIYAMLPGPRHMKYRREKQCTRPTAVVEENPEAEERREMQFEKTGRQRRRREDDDSVKRK